MVVQVKCASGESRPVADCMCKDDEPLDSLTIIHSALPTFYSPSPSRYQLQSMTNS